MTGSGEITTLTRQLQDLQSRLAEAEETLQAIRRGEVDAVIVQAESGPQIYTLKSAEEPYRKIVERMREGAVTIATDGTILYCNDAFARLIGEEAEHVMGSSLAPRIEEGRLSVLIDAGYPGGELRLRSANGKWIDCHVSSARLIVGDHTVHSLVMTDLTRQTLWQRHEAILDATSDAIYSLSPDLIIETWNRGAVQLYGYQPQEIIGRSERILCTEDDDSILSELAARVRRENKAAKADMSRRRKDGSILHVILSLAPLRDDVGDLVGFAAVAHDITERKTAERTQKMLLGELSHRVKNTLASVQSLANHTLRNTPTPVEFAATFSGRIRALARAHEVLTQGAWQSADLTTLIREQLLIGGEADNRVVFSGPQIVLDAQAALILALILHELGTNARKHGALTAPQGKVALRWETDSTCASAILRLTWQESDGPPVRAPNRHGFGSQLIEHHLSTIGGSAVIHFEPEGVRCEISVPLRQSQHTEDVASWQNKSVFS